MRRRDFITAAAGAALARPASAAAAAAKPASGRRIRQGLWRINFGADTRLTLDQQCAFAKSLGLFGFDVIPPADWPTLARHGLKPLIVGPGDTDYLTGLVHPAAHERVLRGIGDQIEVCRKGGCERIALTAGQRRGLSYAQAADNAVEVCKRLAPKLEAGGVTLAIENVNDRRGDPALSREDMVFGHWDWGIEVVERVGSANVKLLCDFYHLQIMDGDLTARVRRDIRHIAHFHVAGVPTRAEIDGRQEVDYRRIAEVIAELPYTGYVCHEWRPTPGADPLKAIEQAVRLMDV